ncbi:goannatyrotoxin-Vere1 [Striga asiatica]|uniref:Goannatyrotoxin-Vere1 n=1 Tax=Striga asiatica TaxID=4170 RepID=A0A5A7R8T0_STRAF|nr:goannatyrotoxin-Vere1 [Striga asiatica]
MAPISAARRRHLLHRTSDAPVNLCLLFAAGSLASVFLRVASRLSAASPSSDAGCFASVPRRSVRLRPPLRRSPPSPPRRLASSAAASIASVSAVSTRLLRRCVVSATSAVSHLAGFCEYATSDDIVDVWMTKNNSPNVFHQERKQPDQTPQACEVYLLIIKEINNFLKILQYAWRNNPRILDKHLTDIIFSYANLQMGGNKRRTFLTRSLGTPISSKTFTVTFRRDSSGRERRRGKDSMRYRKEVLSEPKRFRPPRLASTYYAKKKKGGSCKTKACRTSSDKHIGAGRREITSQASGGGERKSFALQERENTFVPFLLGHLIHSVFKLYRPLITGPCGGGPRVQVVKVLDAVDQHLQIVGAAKANARRVLPRNSKLLQILSDGFSHFF